MENPSRKYKVGDVAYLVENNRYVTEGKVTHISGDIVTFIFSSGKGGIKIDARRLFSTEEAALNSIHKNRSSYERHYRAIMA